MSTTPTAPTRGRDLPPDMAPADLAAMGGRLRECRAAADYSQRQLAERAGVSHAVVSRIESGRYAPALGTLYALARALGVPAATLTPGPSRE